MTSFEEILRVYRLERVELQAWIEQRWVRPRTSAQGPVFDETDEARISLIRELRQEFLCNDDALDVVLSLLDQLYATRRVLKSLEDAIETLPEPVRAQIQSKLRPHPRP
jgi:chaperone modulatory protein CbpM